MKTSSCRQPRWPRSQRCFSASTPHSGFGWSKATRRKGNTAYSSGFSMLRFMANFSAGARALPPSTSRGGSGGSLACSRCQNSRSAAGTASAAAPAAAR